MTDRWEIARRAARVLRQFSEERRNRPVLLGFDGFVDSIISVVDTRHDADRYDAVATIEEFGRKVVSAAGQSSNFELVVRLQKLGGNGPIMANALAAAGLPITYVGSLGFPAIHPVFQELGRRATCYSIADPGLTDALEFQDGKVMLGKHQALRDVCWKQIRDALGMEKLMAIVRTSSLLGMVNWTMLPCVTEIWRHMIDEVFAPMAQELRVRGEHPSGSRKRVFIDLADPEKRTRADLREALGLCTEFQQFANVTLGLNLREAVQVASALDITLFDDVGDQIEPLARTMRESLGVHTVVIHPRASAAAASFENGVETSAFFLGPFSSQPRISTGAGDNFNAGFCLGELAGLGVAECLCVGTALSGYYVRNAASPTLEQLIRFIEELPPAQAQA